MGYHVIFREEGGKINHEYVREKHELASLPITENTIIYKGEPHWVPAVVKESSEYRPLSDMRYRGSILAERIFMEQACKNGYMIEILEQDQNSFKQYYEVSNDFLKIKRGDFLIRNVRNLEIEVKCKTIYSRGASRHFYFEKDHYEKHLKMQDYTKTPIILAIYARKSTNDGPNPKLLWMIGIDYISKLIDDGIIKQMKRDWGPAYQIKINRCMENFELIEFYKKKYGIV